MPAILNLQQARITSNRPGDMVHPMLGCRQVISIRTYGNCIAECSVTCQPLLIHTSQHGNRYIRVVVNLDLALVLVEAM